MVYDEDKIEREGKAQVRSITFEAKNEENNSRYQVTEESRRRNMLKEKRKRCDEEEHEDPRDLERRDLTKQKQINSEHEWRTNRDEQIDTNKNEDRGSSSNERENYIKEESLRKNEGEESYKKRRTEKSSRNTSNIEGHREDNMSIAYVVQLIHGLEEK
ncbi:8850_t:CDS:2, partial [Scutellospora calospora]